jgi:hypothetical protein
MKNYYKLFDLNTGAKESRAVAKLWRVIDQAADQQAINPDVYAAMHVFAHPPLKKYYDHQLQGKALSQRVQGALDLQIKKIEAIESNERPLNRDLQMRAFIRVAWFNIILGSLALQFIFDDLVQSHDRFYHRRFLGRLGGVRAALVRFMWVYGIAILLVTQNLDFLPLPIAIFFFRLWFFYREERVEFCYSLVQDWREELDLNLERKG